MADPATTVPTPPAPPADQAGAPAPPAGDDLAQLVQSTTVLNDAEKKYWMDLLPSMNDDQKNQLRTILGQEQQNQEKIEQNTTNKLQQASEKMLSRWDGEKAKAERMKLRKKEEAHLDEDKEAADALLQGWE